MDNRRTYGDDRDPMKYVLGESDPHGKDPHQSGAKLDAGIARMSLVFMDMNLALDRVAGGLGGGSVDSSGSGEPGADGAAANTNY